MQTQQSLFPARMYYALLHWYYNVCFYFLKLMFTPWQKLVLNYFNLSTTAITVLSNICSGKKEGNDN